MQVSASGHGLPGVYKEVEKYLLHLVAIRLDSGQIGLKVVVDLDLLFSAPEHGGTFKKHIVDLEGLYIVFAATGIAKKLLSQSRRAEHMRLDTGQMLLVRVVGIHVKQHQGGALFRVSFPAQTGGGEA